jgi:hypothetical protein
MSSYTVGVHSDGRFGKGHTKRGEYGIGPINGCGDRGGVVDIATAHLEVPMLDREAVGPAGEGHDVVILVER